MDKKDCFELYVIVSGVAIQLGTGSRGNLIQLKSMLSDNINKEKNTCYVMIDEDKVAYPLYDDPFSLSCLSEFKNTVLALNVSGVYCTDKKNTAKEFIEQYGEKAKESHNILIKSFIDFLESPGDRSKLLILKNSIGIFNKVAETAKCELGVQLTCDIHSEITNGIYSDCMIGDKRTTINSCKLTS